MDSRPQQNSDFSTWLSEVEARRPQQRHFEVPHNILDLPCGCRRKRVPYDDQWKRPRTRVSEGFSIIKVSSPTGGVFWQHLACEKNVTEPVKPRELAPTVLLLGDQSYPRNPLVEHL